MEAKKPDLVKAEVIVGVVVGYADADGTEVIEANTGDTVYVPQTAIDRNPDKLKAAGEKDEKATTKEAAKEAPKAETHPTPRRT